MPTGQEITKVAHVIPAPVAAGAYLASHEGRSLWHGLVLNDANEPVGVLCSTVKLESILDDSTQWGRHGITCEACRRKFRSLPDRCTLEAMTTESGS